MRMWWIPVFSLLLVAGCGGGAAESNGGMAVSTPPASGGVAAADSGSHGAAAAGAQCDYGGAERYTCGAGLQCCYPPGNATPAFGRCQAQCAD